MATDVCDTQELFSTIGPLVRVRIHYDRAGRSTGEADVVFSSLADAKQSITAYDGVTLDGMPWFMRRRFSRY